MRNGDPEEKPAISFEKFVSAVARVPKSELDATQAREVSVHPDLLAFARAYSEKQRAFQEAWKALDDSNKKLMATEVDHPHFYDISREHARIFQASIDASRALEDAQRKMLKRAAELANLPVDHPLWKHVQ